jgi:hypothetical protein
MQYPVELKFKYPERLSRLPSFFICFMVIPHAIILYFLSIAAAAVWIVAWFAILFTGRNPRSLFNFMVWYTQWSTRVNAYSMFLTNKYPPFSGEPSTIEPPKSP